MAKYTHIYAIEDEKKKSNNSELEIELTAMAILYTESSQRMYEHI